MLAILLKTFKFVFQFPPIFFKLFPLFLRIWICYFIQMSVEILESHPHWPSLLGWEAALPCWWRSSPKISSHQLYSRNHYSYHHHIWSSYLIIIIITLTLSPDLTSWPLSVHLQSGAGSPTTGIERSSCWFTWIQKWKWIFLKWKWKKGIERSSFWLT